MSERQRTNGKTLPISVLMDARQRDRIAAEAERRGLGISSTIRALALERIADLERDEQLARARRWQLGQMRRTMARIAREGPDEVSADEIDALFED